MIRAYYKAQRWNELAKLANSRNSLAPPPWRLYNEPQTGNAPLVKQITVNHFDPEKDDVPAKEGVFKTNIRTSWYLVNVDLFATD
jgi:hypothetical protein